MTCKLCAGSGMTPTRDGQFERCLCAVARVWLARQPLDRPLNLLAELFAQFADEHVRFVEEQRKGARLPLDRPCSACGDGDTEMKYHDHASEGPPPIPVPQPRSFSGGEVEMDCFRYAIRNSAPSPAASPAPEAREADWEKAARVRAEREPSTAIIAALRAELAAAQQENERLLKWQNDVEEREAACCPEDVGFDEFIAVLRKRVAELEQALEEIKEETKRKQLPITADIHEIAERVLRPTPKEGQ